MIDEKPNAPRVVERAEVLQNLSQALKTDTDLFLNEQLNLFGHGQKHRLLEAIVKYPMEDISFPNEPEMSGALATLKRQMDLKVAIATEIVIESLAKQQEEYNAKQKEVSNGEESK